MRFRKGMNPILGNELLEKIIQYHNIDIELEISKLEYKFDPLFNTISAVLIYLGYDTNQHRGTRSGWDYVIGYLNEVLDEMESEPCT